MTPSAKAVLAGIHILALGCILVSLTLYADEFGYLLVSHEAAHPTSGVFVLALKGVPILAGGVLYWKGRSLAESLTKDLN
jgi:hypothetical protein